jgi:hypothetical protein
MWFGPLVRDQEVEGSNPFAPTTILNHLSSVAFLRIGSIWVQHRPETDKLLEAVYETYRSASCFRS